MKIVVLTSRFPYPIEKGDKLRMYHQLKGLSKENDLHLISLSHDQITSESKDHIKQFCSSIRIFNVSKVNSIINAGFALFNNLPFQVNYFRSLNLKTKIKREIEAIAPDVIYCQLIRVSEYVRDLDCPKVLDFMDAFSLNYKRRASFENPLKALFFKIESRRLAVYEKKILHDFDAASIISDTDKEEISTGSEISKISNGLDTTYFRPLESQTYCDIVFVGNMGYHPNVLAAVYLVERILPLLPKEVKLKIAGARPNTRVLDLNSDQVEVTGWIDDIRTAYASAKVFVAPIFSGAGQQNKIMEAMAMEKICIVSSIVNEGINAQKDKEVLIADSAEEFADLINKVLRNIEQYRHVGRNARKFIESHFSWESENKKLEIILLEEAKR